MTTQTSAFAGRVVVLTGAAGRLAATTALLLAERGAKIAAIDRPGSDFQLLSDALPPNHWQSFEADVRCAEQVKDAVAGVLGRFSRIDVAFNAAGISGPVRPLVDYPDEEFARVIDINVKGVFHCMKHILPTMVAQRSGVIVNACSLAGFRGSKGLCGYAASKHAVAGLTKVGANENARHGVRVVAIAPGPIESPMVDRHLSLSGQDLDTTKSAAAAGIPQGRLGTADEVAKLVAFLASDEASYINGSIVQIDGALGVA